MSSTNTFSLNAAAGYTSRLLSKRELVTITVVKEDYEMLKSLGGPNQSQVERALNTYLSSISKAHPPVHKSSWQRGQTIRFLCAIPHNLSNEIKRLSGRFDSHTIRAFRIFLR